MEIKSQPLRSKYSKMASNVLIARIENGTLPENENNLAIEVAKYRFTRNRGKIIDLKLITSAELTKMLKDAKLQMKYKKRLDRILKEQDTRNNNATATPLHIIM